MASMTPILELQVIGTSISFVDGSGQLNIIAQCNTEQDTMIAALALAKHHGVKLYKYKAREHVAEEVTVR